MSEGSHRYILSNRRPNNKLREDCIAVALKEALIGLRLVHNTKRVHRTFNQGDIFVHIDDNATDSGRILIKLAFEASVYDSENINTNENEHEEASSSAPLLNVKGITKWGAAPEAFERDNDTTTPKSDIWLSGITSLELAYGDLPVSNREELDCIIMKLREKKRLPRSLEKLLKKKGIVKKTLDLFKRKVFLKEFERMVLNCLCEDLEKRPTVDEILNTPFFTKQRDMKKFEKFLFNGKNPGKRPIDN
ncbi:serine/threonine-protein kinase BLUS1-like [Lycium barbarum]|uniref:serine/threonine-protein kinase BLUS1-like n=1 Tax=Lycium barbarum TaxID=112863 RepID=UPI00293E93DF|nr:serine/threonine-protein kinase BLUS1-like [Lycium barbarum]